MRKTDLAYFAGIFDGEGCISIKSTRTKYGQGKISYSHSLEVSVGNTNEWLCRQLCFSFGGSVNSQKSTGKPVWRWHIAAVKAKTFLIDILPYLKLKRPQAEIAIQFQKSKYMRGKQRLTEAELTLADTRKFLIQQMNGGQGKYKRKATPEDNPTTPTAPTT